MWNHTQAFVCSDKTHHVLTDCSCIRQGIPIDAMQLNNMEKLSMKRIPSYHVRQVYSILCFIENKTIYPSHKSGNRMIHMLRQF